METLNDLTNVSGKDVKLENGGTYNMKQGSDPAIAVLNATNANMTATDINLMIRFFNVLLAGHSADVVKANLDKQIQDKAAEVASVVVGNL